MKNFSLLILVCILTLMPFAIAEIEEHKWEQDLSQSMKIGITMGGYTRAVLECSADWMAFVVSMEEEFDGVMYTKGDFYRQDTPCFLSSSGGKDLVLKLPYEDCSTKHDDDMGGYTTTVVVQHDKDLITPGDLAFELLCKDERSVNASMQGMRSQISLVDADPAAKPSGGSFSAMSASTIVTITPPKKGLKEEL